MPSCGDLFKKYKSEQLAASFVPFAEAIEQGLVSSPLLDSTRLWPSMRVSAPLVVRLAASSGAPGTLFGLIPHFLDRSLSSCLLVTLANWKASACPISHDDTDWDSKSVLGQGGVRVLLGTYLYAQSSARILYDEALRSVMSSDLPDILKPERFARSLRVGWAGTEELKPVRLWWWKTLFQRLRFHGSTKRARLWAVQ